MILLIAHALQNQTHYRVLSFLERFGGHSDILRDGWGEKIGWGKGSFRNLWAYDILKQRFPIPENEHLQSNP